MFIVTKKQRLGMPKKSTQCENEITVLESPIITSRLVNTNDYINPTEKV